MSISNNQIILDQAIQYVVNAIKTKVEMAKSVDLRYIILPKFKIKNDYLDKNSKNYNFQQKLLLIYQSIYTLLDTKNNKLKLKKTNKEIKNLFTLIMDLILDIRSVHLKDYIKLIHQNNMQYIILYLFFIDSTEKQFLLISEKYLRLTSDLLNLQKPLVQNAISLISPITVPSKTNAKKNIFKQITQQFSNVNLKNTQAKNIEIISSILTKFKINFNELPDFLIDLLKSEIAMQGLLNIKSHVDKIQTKQQLSVEYLNFFFTNINMEASTDNHLFSYLILCRKIQHQINAYSIYNNTNNRLYNINIGYTINHILQFKQYQDITSDSEQKIESQYKSHQFNTNNIEYLTYSLEVVFIELKQYSKWPFKDITETDFWLTCANIIINPKFYSPNLIIRSSKLINDITLGLVRSNQYITLLNLILNMHDLFSENETHDEFEISEYINIHQLLKQLNISNQLIELSKLTKKNIINDPKNSKLSLLVFRHISNSIIQLAGFSIENKNYNSLKLLINFAKTFKSQHKKINIKFQFLELSKFIKKLLNFNPQTANNFKKINIRLLKSLFSDKNFSSLNELSLSIRNHASKIAIKILEKHEIASRQHSGIILLLNYIKPILELLNTTQDEMNKLKQSFKVSTFEKVQSLKCEAFYLSICKEEEEKEEQAKKATLKKKKKKKKNQDPQTIRKHNHQPIKLH